MTVKELIDKLQQFDEYKLVLVEDTDYGENRISRSVRRWISTGLPLAI